MRIPKNVYRLLEKRERLAMDLIDACHAVDTWLEEQGADLTDPDLQDSTISGCMIYCEPGTARMQVEQYIKDKL